MIFTIVKKLSWITVEDVRNCIKRAYEATKTVVWEMSQKSNENFVV